jgi:hypothetical protein
LAAALSAAPMTFITFEMIKSHPKNQYSLVVRMTAELQLAPLE